LAYAKTGPADVAVYERVNKVGVRRKYKEKGYRSEETGEYDTDF